MLIVQLSLIYLLHLFQDYMCSKIHSFKIIMNKNIYVQNNKDSSIYFKYAESA